MPKRSASKQNEGADNGRRVKLEEDEVVDRLELVLHRIQFARDECGARSTESEMTSDDSEYERGETAQCTDGE